MKKLLVATTVAIAGVASLCVAVTHTMSPQPLNQMRFIQAPAKARAPVSGSSAATGASVPNSTKSDAELQALIREGDALEEKAARSEKEYLSKYGNADVTAPAITESVAGEVARVNAQKASAVRIVSSKINAAQTAVQAFSVEVSSLSKQPAQTQNGEEWRTLLETLVQASQRLDMAKAALAQGYVADATSLDAVKVRYIRDVRLATDQLRASQARLREISPLLTKLTGATDAQAHPSSAAFKKALESVQDALQEAQSELSKAEKTRESEAQTERKAREVLEASRKQLEAGYLLLKQSEARSKATKAKIKDTQAYLEEVDKWLADMEKRLDAANASHGKKPPKPRAKGSGASQTQLKRMLQSSVAQPTTELTTIRFASSLYSNQASARVVFVQSRIVPPDNANEYLLGLANAANLALRTWNIARRGVRQAQAALRAAERALTRAENAVTRGQRHLSAATAALNRANKALDDILKRCHTQTEVDAATRAVNEAVARQLKAIEQLGAAERARDARSQEVDVARTNLANRQRFARGAEQDYYRARAAYYNAIAQPV